MGKFIGLNWKLNPKTKKEAINLSNFCDKKGIVIFPPFIFLDSLKQSLKKAKLGAQNVFWEENGAFTGEVSPIMLKKLGVEYVLIGHSERRRFFGETSKIINKKIKQSLTAQLKVVLCVGETKEIRKSGIKFVKNYLQQELSRDLEKIKVSELIVAYEPFWAIGSGKADNPQESAQIIGFIKDFLKMKNVLNYKVIYGGSINSKNVFAFSSFDIIDGVLVGKASLEKSELKKIFSAFYVS